MAALAYAVLVVCCLFSQGLGVLGDTNPCGTYGPDYTCFLGLPVFPGYSGLQGHQLCQTTDSYICPDPGNNVYGCGSQQVPCGYNNQPSPSYSGLKAGQTTSSSSLSGDPFLEGFDGRTFDFMGTKNEVFNMITHPDHQLNAAFIDADFPAFPTGTFIGGVGILHRSHQVQAHIRDDGTLNVVADGVALTSDHGRALGDAFVELDAFGTSLVFRSNLCIWKIMGVAPFTWNDDFYKAHIDMQLQLIQDPAAMHGVLGQTLNAPKNVWPEEDLHFHGEGQMDDYRMTHLLATDFKYNMFGKDGPTPLVLTRPRMLLANAATKSATTYPITASVSAHPHAHRV